MDIVQAAKSRYSTKVFDPTRKLPQEKIDAVKELIRFSPSSVNSQPWHSFWQAQKKANSASLKRRKRTTRLTRRRFSTLLTYWCFVQKQASITTTLKR